MNWRDIPLLTRRPGWQCDMPWDGVEGWLSSCEPELDPDFQRGHVWTTAQREAYILHCLRGGESARVINFNSPTYHRGMRGDLVIVDGLQRLTSVRLFMSGHLSVLGGETVHSLGGVPHHLGCCLRICVNNLRTRSEILTWYLEINSGGTPHPPEEIERVRALLTQSSTTAAGQSDFSST